MQSVYLDHAATTPLHPDVLDAMLDVMRGQAGNPSSIHAYGRKSRSIINRSRDRIADLLGCHSTELVFTSGGTESDNMALIGAARAMRKRGKSHIITAAIEHHAVLHTCGKLQDEGFSISIIAPGSDGRIDPESIRERLQSDTGLISVMSVNNETGTIQPIEEIGRLAREHGAVYHVDAVQALGALPVALNRCPIDLASFSAHKINGPQGIGALYIARGTPLEPLLYGGTQERKRRAGTENTAGIAGFAAAVEIAVQGLEQKQTEMRKLRNRFVALLEERLGPSAIRLNGHQKFTAEHIVNLSVLGTDTETMLMSLDVEGIAASGGSACTSGSLERSHVLKSMKLPEEQLNSAVRFSFGLGNTIKEIEYAAEKIATIAGRIRNNL